MVQRTTRNTGIIASSTKTNSEPTCTTVASTRPVGVYYPSRRPNIFRARAKHLRFPEFDHKPVTSDAVDKSAGDMEEDDDEFTMEDLEELQSAQKEKTEKKTKKFVSIVQQTTWGSRVEDLGTVHEIEEE